MDFRARIIQLQLSRLGLTFLGTHSGPNFQVIIMVKFWLLNFKYML